MDSPVLWMLLLAALASTAYGAPAQHIAASSIDQDEAAVAAISSVGGGRVLSVRNRQTEGEAAVFEVKVLSADGRVRVVRVDAQTGAVQK